MKTLQKWALAAATFAAVAPWAAAPERAGALAAQSGAAGSLGAGGTLTGDISKEAGDEDVVTMDLLAGCTLDAKFTSAFAADVTFTAPSGATADLGWGTAPTRTRKGFPVTESGTWTFRIASADGSQGKYTLTTSTKWAKKVVLTGETGGSVSWNMPAGASVKGKVLASPAKSWTPVIDSVTAPNGSGALGAPVTGKNGVAVLKTIRATQGGEFTMDVSGGTEGGAFQAQLALVAPKLRPAKTDISNGITAVSFEKDGVADLLKQKCAVCHTWTGSAAAFRSHASQSAARMQSGNMPQGGPRAPASDVALIKAWIATGYAQ